MGATLSQGRIRPTALVLLTRLHKELQLTAGVKLGSNSQRSDEVYLRASA